MKAFWRVGLVLALVCGGVAVGQSLLEGKEKEAEVWRDQKERLYQRFEKLVLPPKGTSMKDVSAVFGENIHDEEGGAPNERRLGVWLFLVGDIGHVRNKMYCGLCMTVVDDRIEKSWMSFSGDIFYAPAELNAKDPYRSDYRLVGLLNGYLQWKPKLDKASWNRDPN